MSLFQIAVVRNSVSMESMQSKVAVERNISELPADVKQELYDLFDTEDLVTPRWTKTGVYLDGTSPLYYWYLYCKAEDMLGNMEEPAVVNAMEMYLDYIPESQSA